MPKIKETKAASDAAQSIIAYKAFDKDLKCRNFQYAVGESYTHDGAVELCGGGFHACTEPLDVLQFYTDRFARVVLSGQIDGPETGAGCSKVAGGIITIEREITLTELIADAVRQSPAASSGNYATNASSGNYATNASSGNYATNASSGNYATNASSGNYATNASSGYYATNASSGYYAKNASSGNYATNASSGNYATNASSGNSAKNASSGYYAKNEANGEYSVIVSAGKGSIAKGVAGTQICIAEYEGSRCIGFATGCVGEDGIPADTWLKASGGRLVPCD